MILLTELFLDTLSHKNTTGCCLLKLHLPVKLTSSIHTRISTGKCSTVIIPFTVLQCVIFTWLCPLRVKHVVNCKNRYCFYNKNLVVLTQLYLCYIKENVHLYFCRCVKICSYCGVNYSSEYFIILANNFMYQFCFKSLKTLAISFNMILTFSSR